MSKKSRLSEPLSWAEVSSSDGKLLGRYAVDKGIIIVRSAKGWEKRAMASRGGGNEGLALLILSEGPPLH